MSKEKDIFLVYIVGEIENSELKDWLDSDKESTSPLELLPDQYAEMDIWFYGFTRSKKLIKRFMEIRNKNKMVVFRKSMKDYFSSEDEFEKFRSQFRTCEIIDTTVTTRSLEKGKANDIVIPIVLTRFEYEFIEISFEGFDDAAYEAYDQLDKMEIIFECLNEKTKRTLYDAGISKFVLYLKEIYGSSVVADQIVALDELHVLLNYFYDLFEGGIKK